MSKIPIPVHTIPSYFLSSACLSYNSLCLVPQVPTVEPVNYWFSPSASPSSSTFRHILNPTIVLLGPLKVSLLISFCLVSPCPLLLPYKWERMCMVLVLLCSTPPRETGIHKTYHCSGGPIWTALSHISNQISHHTILNWPLIRHISHPSF